MRGSRTHTWHITHPHTTTSHHNKGKGSRPFPLRLPFIHHLDLSETMRTQNIIRKPVLGASAKLAGPGLEHPLLIDAGPVRRLTLLCLKTASICASTPLSKQVVEKDSTGLLP